MSEEAEKMFTVRAMKLEDAAKAKVLESLCNRPDFVARVMDEVNKKVKDMMETMLWSPNPRRTDRE